MKFIFVIQGEGRGHMTQALALFDFLTARGHEVSNVLIGKSDRRQIPDFVRKGLGTRLTTFESPNFVTDKGEKSININKTIWHNFSRANRYIKSLQLLHGIVQESQPDVIVNFYDLLAGIYNLIFRPRAQFWGIGHQYLIYHPEFPFAPAAPVQNWLFRLNTHLTCLGADQLLALSFRPLAELPNSKLRVIPPLLRPLVKTLAPAKGDFILTYMVNPGYAEEVISFSKRYPSIKIEAFWDKKDMPSTYRPTPSLVFHQINDTLYLQKMAECRGLLSTAGFESICEAMYFGKPVMMVPVAGQYEQACNALDAELANAGFTYHEFNFKKFDIFLKSHQNTPANFVNWEKQLGNKLTEILSTRVSKEKNSSFTYPKYATET